MGMETNSCGDGWDGMEVLRGWVGMEVNKLDGMDIKSAGKDGNGCNFCPRTGL